ncbi:MAG TPA: hypothetical protein VF980_09470 [Thermoanaerobaculia bacterium]
MVRNRTAVMLLLVVCVAACQSRLKEADALIRKGSLLEAEHVLAGELKSRPGDPDVRLMLGRVYLLEQRKDDAIALLGSMSSMRGLTPRVAREYRDAAIALSRRSDTPPTVADYASTAARFDPTLAPSMCQMLLQQMRRTRIGWRQVAPAAAKIDQGCRAKTLRVMRSWIDEPIDISELQDLVLTAGQIDSEASLEFARAIRDRAKGFASTDRERARQLLDVAMRANAELGSELETVVLRSSINEPAGVPVTHELGQDFLNRYSGKPLEVTKRLMSEIAEGLTAYLTRYNRYPQVRSMYELMQQLRGLNHTNVPMVDAWGTQFTYISSRQGSGRLISGGADRHVEQDSLNFAVRPRGVVPEHGADIIWEDGRFVQEPAAQAIESFEGVNAVRR